MSDWKKHYEKVGALWIYQGEPDASKPHALLTSGQHSAGYFNSAIVTADASTLDRAAFDLVDQFATSTDSDWEDVDCVVGPAMGAITLAHSIALKLTYARPSHRACMMAYAEKKGDGANRVFSFNKSKPPKNARILLCEDVATTVKSILGTKKACEEAGCKVVPFVLCLVNRSGKSQIEGMHIISLIEDPMPTFDVPEGAECPYCKVGSEALKPKEGNNWNLLMGGVMS